MNKAWKAVAMMALCAVTTALAAPAWAQMGENPKNSRGEQYFIISSVDLEKHQLVLMYPTQLTVIAAVDDNTMFAGENGEKLTLNDLRAGATVWAVTRPQGKGKVLALRIREGAMTPAELHKLYLDTKINPADFAPLPKPGAQPPNGSAAPPSVTSKPGPAGGFPKHPRRAHLRKTS